ncbi:40S ribosomal protein S9 [Kalaharituber pfeilii]|nr:40S ribosomal protein S9 [Kalaharituber pfeilii]
MASIWSPLRRCCARPLFEASFRSLRTPLAPSAIPWTGHFRPITNSASVSQEPLGQTHDEYVVTRLAPVSPSYFTGSADFFDNWLALQELHRKYQTLPVVPSDEATRVRWKTLQQYRAAVGTQVKAAKYKKIVNLLNRLNRIEPSLLPQEAKIMLEKFKREADTNLAKPKEQQLDKWGRACASGRRKTSIARVWLVEGTGEALVNGKPLAQAFPRIVDRENVIWPLHVTDRVDKYNIWALVKGGGSTGQAEALTLAVAKALMIHEPLLKPVLRRAGCVTRDPRSVERKKPGHVKARKMPTWVKR